MEDKVATPMAHDVFISYSSKDKHAADAACAAIEAGGVRCWIAPRDILPGSDWGEAIISGINGSQAMVLVFSNHCNQSPQISREVERAVNKGIPIVPFRIEDVKPARALEYFISTPHWLDAFEPPLERHFGALVQTLKRLLSGEHLIERNAAGRGPRRTAVIEPKAARNSCLLFGVFGVAAAGVFAVLLCGLLYVLFVREPRERNGGAGPQIPAESDLAKLVGTWETSSAEFKLPAQGTWQVFAMKELLETAFSGPTFHGHMEVNSLGQIKSKLSAEVRGHLIVSGDKVMFTASTGGARSEVTYFLGTYSANGDQRMLVLNSDKGRWQSSWVEDATRPKAAAPNTTARIPAELTAEWKILGQVYLQSMDGWDAALSIQTDGAFVLRFMRDESALLEIEHGHWKRTASLIVAEGRYVFEGNDQIRFVYPDGDMKWRRVK